MINKQRVRRIRRFIYACILLLIFVPIILMITVSFRTMSLLQELTAILSQNSPASISDTLQQGTASNAADSVTEPGGPTPNPPAEGNSAADEENMVSSEASASGSGNGDEAGSALGQNGESVTNTYLPDTYPELYFDTIPTSSPPAENTLYLTFDNTPSARLDTILDVLARHDVRATFFVWWNVELGEENPALFQKIVDAGHQIGLHSGDNDKTFAQLYSSVDSFLADYEKIFTAVSQSTGVKPRIYRLPGGSINPYDAERQQILAEIKTELDARGFLQFDWTASAQDAVSPALTKDQILRNIQNSIGNGNPIILLAHDGTGSNSTAEALDEFIGLYKAKGYAFGVLENDIEPVSFLR